MNDSLSIATLLSQYHFNVTYHVYELRQVDKNGRKQELRFDEAVRVMDIDIAPDVKQKSRLVKFYPGCSWELLCHCKYFKADPGDYGVFIFCDVEILPSTDVPRGNGKIETMDEEQKLMKFCKGETVFLLGGLGRYLVIKDTMILKIYC